MLNRPNEPDHDVDFHLEYTLAKNKTDFFLHMSFTNIDTAKYLFVRMKDEWHLPVALYGNRIVVAPARKGHQYTGTYTSLHQDVHQRVEYACVRFTCRDHSRKFYQFIFKDDIKSASDDIRIVFKNEMLITYLDSDRIYYPKNSFFHPYHSLETRIIETKNVESIIFSFFVLTQLLMITSLPKDVIHTIRLLFFLMSSSFDFQKRIEINNRFSLGAQSIPLPHMHNNVNALELKTLNSVSYPDIDISEQYKNKQALSKPSVMFSNIDSTGFDTAINPFDKPKKMIIQSCSSQAAAKHYYEQHNVKPLISVIENHSDDILTLSNAPYAMPKDIGSGLVESFGGLYVISHAEIKLDEKITPVDFVFVAIPHLASGYLRYVTTLMIMQFQLAVLNNNVLILSRHDQDENMAAIIHAVNRMPEFNAVQVIFALQDNAMQDVYEYPSEDIIKEVDKCINRIRLDTDLKLDKLSDDLRGRYIHGKKMVDHEIITDIDLMVDDLNNGFIERLYYFTLFATDSESETSERIKKMHITCLNYLKECVIEFSYARKTLDEAITFWEKTPASDLKLDFPGMHNLTLYDIICLNPKGKKTKPRTTRTAIMLDKFEAKHKPCLGLGFNF